MLLQQLLDFSMDCPVCNSPMVIGRESFDFWCLNDYVKEYECLDCGFSWFDDTEGLNAPPTEEEDNG